MELLSALLTRIRKDAGYSQQELALRLDISQRHISFIERDRARPSRPLLLAWLAETKAPPFVVSAAMARAGYALNEAGSAPETLEKYPDREALSLLLRAHDPNPAFVFDADWRIVKANPATLFLCNLLMPAVMVDQDDSLPLDMVAAVTRPDGFYSQMRWPRLAAEALLAQLRSEEWARPELRDGNDRFEASIRTRFPHDPEVPVSQMEADAAAERVFSFDSRHGILTFFRAQVVAGLPQDVTATSLRVELWYAANSETAAVMAARETLSRRRSRRMGAIPISGNVERIFAQAE